LRGIVRKHSTLPNPEVTMRRALPCLALLLILAIPASALADVLPVPPTPENCAIDTKEQPGTECQSCAVIAGDDAICTDQFDGTDFAYVCSTDSIGSEWEEVWCDGPPREGCSMVGPVAGSALALLLVGLGLIGLRRRS
jgi:MYXO-CTERM domain-containing protein